MNSRAELLSKLCQSSTLTSEKVRIPGTHLEHTAICWRRRKAIQTYAAQAAFLRCKALEHVSLRTRLMCEQWQPKHPPHPFGRKFWQVHRISASLINYYIITGVQKWYWGLLCGVNNGHPIGKHASKGMFRDVDLWFWEKIERRDARCVSERETAQLRDQTMKDELRNTWGNPDPDPSHRYRIQILPRSRHRQPDQWNRFRSRHDPDRPISHNFRLVPLDSIHGLPDNMPTLDMYRQ